MTANKSLYEMKIEELKQKLEALAKQFNEEYHRATNKFKVGNYVVVTSCIYDEDGIDVAFAVFDKDVDEKEVDLDFIEKNAIAFFKVCAENYTVTHFVKDDKVFNVLTNSKIQELREESLKAVGEREKKLDEFLKKYKELLKQYQFDIAITIKRYFEKKNIRISLYDEEVEFLIDNYIDEINEDMFNFDKLVEYFANLILRIMSRIFTVFKQEKVLNMYIWLDVITRSASEKYFKVEILAFDNHKRLRIEDINVRKEYIGDEEKRKILTITRIVNKITHSYIFLSFNLENKDIKIEVYSDLFSKYKTNEFRENEYTITVYDKKRDKTIYRIDTSKEHVARVLEDLAKIYNIDLTKFEIDRIVYYIIPEY